VRVTRNCPWNQCTFCPVYKGTKFSRRPVDHVKKDIDAVYQHVEGIRKFVDEQDRVPRSEINRITANVDPKKSPAFVAAFNWYFAGGLESVFIQDANSLIIKTTDLEGILRHLKERFPEIKRITSYARSQTVSRMKEGDLKAIGDAGLNRIHIGLESGSDEILKMVKKGVTKGMPLQTADALNQINPDFIRMRTLAIPNRAPLYEDHQSGRFEKCTDVLVVKEILMFIENLDGITSMIKSDHILNLFQELEGKLPEDKERMLKILRTFLAMDPERQALYQLGRRIGVFSSLTHMENPYRMARAQRAYSQLGGAAEDIDRVTNELVKRFI